MWVTYFRYYNHFFRLKNAVKSESPAVYVNQTFIFKADFVNVTENVSAVINETQECPHRE